MIVIDFIVSNYIWFLIAAILAILAILGSYAEKTNFGQSKQSLLLENDSSEEDKIDFETIKGKRINGDVSTPVKSEKNNSIDSNNKHVKVLPEGDYVLINTENIIGPVDTDVINDTGKLVLVEDQSKSLEVNDELSKEQLTNIEKINKAEKLKEKITKLGLKYIDVDQLIKKPKKSNNDFKDLNKKINLALNSEDTTGLELLDEIDDIKLDGIDKTSNQTFDFNDKIDLSDVNVSTIKNKKIWKK